MVKKIKYTNRYNEVYTFTKTEDGNILWEGDFEWCRYGSYVSMSVISQMYAPLVYSDKTKINMVDPSGGPYLHAGQDMGVFNEFFKGMKIEKFEKTDNNNVWKIIIKNEQN